ncbi:hypothetical protein SODALDRAFT_352808 [Sodiomyces alkalinus F11]|uniref:Uncharacterized protein n=1 Tax=Sodiomyces alkalinus (strain CBS 110278 / VKM F-3762 / F11) TaxID=1314773 RepID=A0A3N2PN64_SODAK|nr:hypothetical protein SODALDRAFT_352808 [Sodiomyces alkalinus F11]ROT35952.1 hypothetical protein SODALDRAFT_352808 [Sodiomyces alkalinus F11]
MVKKRIPTICEWALGFTVDDYVGEYERRRQRHEGRTKQRERFRVEVSTDDESEEETIKITYPRSGSPKEKAAETKKPAEGKKVHFDKEPLKSALKKTTDSEEVTTNTGDTSDTDSSTKNTGSNQEGGEDASESSHTDSPQKGTNKADVSDANTSTSESGPNDETASRASKKDKKSSKKKRSRDSGDIPVDASPEDEDQESEHKKKTKDNAKNKEEPDVETADSKSSRSCKSKKSNQSSKQPNAQKASDNNIGPLSDTETEALKAVSEKKSKTKNRPKKRQAAGKVQPEALIAHHVRQPNLIMPVRAEILQVEHAMEGMEDPRPNAFHDAQHNVLRVYHGPVYGNPNGMLYPRRDPSRSALPIGTPHPLANPYFYGFAHPANPGNIQFQNQSPWNQIAYPAMFGPPMMAPPSPAQAKPAQAAAEPSPAGTGAAAEPTQAQDKPTERETEEISPPQNPPPQERSGTVEETASERAKKKGKGRDSGIAQQVSQPSQNSVPINVNMYSYGSRPDPWSRAGRERYAKLNQASNSSAESPEKGGLRQETKDFWDGSCRNNRGPAMYDRDAANRAADISRSNAVHPDLRWSPRPEQQQPSSPQDGMDNGNADGWHNQASPEANKNWNNDNWGNSNNWESTNPQGDVPWGATNPQENWDAAATDGNWTEPANNIGVSSGQSNASGGSKKSLKSNSPKQDLATNLGPTSNEIDAKGDDINVKSSTMPGAWDSGVAGENDAGWDQTTKVVDNGGYSWGDTSAAQVGMW